MHEPTLTDGKRDYLLTLLPADWQELAKTSGGVMRLRGTDSLSSLLRTLLLHIAHRLLFADNLCSGEMRVWLPAPKGSKDRLSVRLCAVRKSVEAVALAERKLKRKASRKQSDLSETTLEQNAWIVVLTTIGPEILSAVEALEWYRVRWQIELAFKRLKSLGDVGHLPKHDAASSRAWVYGKLLVALLTEKMQRHAAAFSPWGGRWLEQDPPPEFLA